MLWLHWLLRRRAEDGASAVEYGLLVAAIAAVIAIMVFGFGGFVSNLFSTSCGTIGGTIAGTSCP
jgi:pilus assembly protein Flp/PilA